MGTCPVCHESFDPSTTRAHLLTFHTGRGGEDKWGCGECSFLGTFDEVAAHCLRLRHDCGAISLRKTVPSHLLVSLLREIQDKMGLGNSEEAALASQSTRNEPDQSASSNNVGSADVSKEVASAEVQDKMGLGKSDEPAQASQSARIEPDQSASSNEMRSASSQKVDGLEGGREVDMVDRGTGTRAEAVPKAVQMFGVRLFRDYSQPFEAPQSRCS